MIVLDSNVLSALMRPDHEPSVVKWLDGQPRLSVWTTAVTILEVRSGIRMLPKGPRRAQLSERFGQLIVHALEGRILPFDLDAAEHAAEIYAIQQKTGRNVGIRDVQIAGIARSRKAELATRNIQHFKDLDLRLVDPWSN